jgi:hypothetical protein
MRSRALYDEASPGGVHYTDGGDLVQTESPTDLHWLSLRDGL